MSLPRRGSKGQFRLREERMGSTSNCEVWAATKRQSSERRERPTLKMTVVVVLVAVICTMSPKGLGLNAIAETPQGAETPKGTHLSQHRNRKKEKPEKKCKDCVATDFPGPDTIKLQYCTAASACKNNSPILLNEIANDQCRVGNTDSCNGDCGEGNTCSGIYDRARSAALTQTAAPAAKNTCKAPLILCDVTLDDRGGRTTGMQV